MARMTEAAKIATPKSHRGVPSKTGTGSYPMNNAKQAAYAVSLGGMHHGPAFAARMRAKAHSLGFNVGSDVKKGSHGKAFG
jgi:hypothetical protein